MLKRDIKYINLDGEEETDTFYFNLSKTELLEMQVEAGGKLQDILEKIVKENDYQKIWDMFVSVVLKSYGVRSDDGKRFIKNEVVREEFKQMPAFDALITEIVSDAEVATSFINGILPSDLAPNAQNVPTSFGSSAAPLPPVQNS